MRRLLGLRVLQYVRSSAGPNRLLQLKVAALPVLCAAATASEAVSPEIVYDRHKHFNENTSSPDLQSGLAFRDTSWRDVPQLARESMNDVYGRINGVIERRLQNEGSRATLYITAANFCIYILWKAAPVGFMVKHFANSLESIRRARVWTTVTSNFSHMGLFHLASNMYLLNAYGSEVADILGSERFYIFYVAAGVASSLASLTFRRLTSSNILSLGASGAVVATLWLYACFFPDRRMSILGSEKTLTMQELVLAYAVIDAAGLLGSSGKIDFAAHLGGAVFGNSWFHLVFLCGVRTSNGTNYDVHVNGTALVGLVKLRYPGERVYNPFGARNIFTMTELNPRSAESEQEIKVNMPFSLPTAPFPDKKREDMANRFQPNSPKVRTGVNPLFLRRISSSGYSSNDETPTKLRRVTSAGSNPDCSRPVKYLFGTPRASDGVPLETAFLSRHVMSEITKDLENDENRPPSPRPSDPLQVYVEHNKQLQVWDDWVTMTNSGVEHDVACVSYRRTESLHAPESLPKSLKPPSLADSKWEN